jgi:hypothetical protein
MTVEKRARLDDREAAGHGTLVLVGAHAGIVSTRERSRFRARRRLPERGPPDGGPRSAFRYGAATTVGQPVPMQVTRPWIVGLIVPCASMYSARSCSMMSRVVTLAEKFG